MKIYTASPSSCLDQVNNLVNLLCCRTQTGHVDFCPVSFVSRTRFPAVTLIPSCDVVLTTLINLHLSLEEKQQQKNGKEALTSPHQLQQNSAEKKKNYISIDLSVLTYI